MTHNANNLIPEQGKFRRALAAAWAFILSMDTSGLDYTLDRIDHLEQEVGRLKEEIRQSQKLRDTGL